MNPFGTVMAQGRSSERTQGKSANEKTPYLYLEYLNEFRSISRLPNMNPINTFNRFCAEALSYISCIDVCSCSERETRADWSSPEDVEHLMKYNPVVGWRLFPGPITIALRWLGIRPFKSSAWRQRQRYNCISQATRILYFVFSFHLLANLYFQYSYDFDRIRLITIDKQLQEIQWQPAERVQLELYKDFLTNRSRATKSMLDSVGAPNANLAFTVECFCLFVVLVGYFVYYLGIVYFSVLMQFDIHVGRELMDEQNETRHFNQLIHAQVEKYIESNRVYNEVVFWEKYHNSVCWTIEQTPPSTCRRRILVSGQAGSNRLTHQGSQRCHQLARCSPSHCVNQVDKYWQRTRQLQHQEQNSVGKLRVNRQASQLASIRSEMSKLHQDYPDTCFKLSLLLSEDALRPFNKAPGNIDRRSIVITVNHAGMFFYVSLMVLLVIFNSIVSLVPSEPFGVPDFLLLVSLCGILMIVGLAGNLSTTYFFAATLDEILAVNKIRELIFRCINANSAEFISLIQQQQQQPNRLLATDTVTGCNSVYMTDSNRFGAAREASKGCWPIVGTKGCLPREDEPAMRCRDIMNTNLLFVLMQYKIFVVQYLPIRNTFKAFMAYATLFSLTFPIILRIHLAYLNVFNVQNIAAFAFIWSLGTLLVFDCTIVPICHLYSCCVDLYRSMSSLLAHIISIETQPKGGDMYNKHAVSTLIKELEDPNRLLDQFKVGFLSMTCTYTTLIQIHFWWGLVVLSILADKQFGGQSFISSIFRDPFGIL